MSQSWGATHVLINNVVKELLKQKNEFSDEKYAALLSKCKEKNSSLIEEVIHQGLFKSDEIYNQVAAHLNIPFVDLQDFKPNYKLITLLPESYARHCQAIILQESSGTLWIGMSDPSNISLQDEIKQQLKQPVSFALVQSDHLKQLFDLVYRNSKEMSSFAEELHDELDSFKIEFNAGSDVIGQVDAPVVKLLQTIFEDALRIQASDIHLEPCKEGLRVRLRVDGVLQEHIMPEKSIIAALSQRLKLMARLDISEKNKPQDGRFTINTNKKKIDVRLSTLPMNGGESVVMRLLTNSAEDLSLDDMGMDPDILDKFRQLISLPHGIILVTGPTGSGKTTTLYAALGELDAVKEKIMTIEDPIERELTNIVQTQVHTKIGLNFSDVLRSSLRQDPDIIMVGEIRDEETAEIAMRAALTGHLVFSTLHTNDSISTAIRLLDMGIKGFLLADALFGVLAQRLARKICPQCKAIYTPTPAELDLLDTVREGARNHTFYFGKGCQYCYHSGYKGRIGIYELLIFNQDIRDALRTNNLEKYQEYASIELKQKLLGDQVLDKAIEGLTTLSELRTIAGGDIT
jgi:MSHA biogenesis protein MshE